VGAGVNGCGERAWEGHGLTGACGGGHKLGLLGAREGASSMGVARLMTHLVYHSRCIYIYILFIT
jgi:hypothetical protein